VAVTSLETGIRVVDARRSLLMGSATSPPDVFVALTFALVVVFFFGHATMLSGLPGTFADMRQTELVSAAFLLTLVVVCALALLASMAQSANTVRIELAREIQIVTSDLPFSASPSFSCGHLNGWRARSRHGNKTNTDPRTLHSAKHR